MNEAEEKTNASLLGAVRPTIIFDVGGVIVTEGIDVAPFAQVLEVKDAAVREAIEAGIWAFRDAYDLGLPDRKYWENVAKYAKLPAPSQKQVSLLVELDASRWSRSNPVTVQFIQELSARGIVCAILSNAPFSIAQRLLSQQWVHDCVTKAVFSCDTGIAKPDDRAFENMIRELSIKPGDAIFFDDRPVNVEAACRSGIDGRIWSGEQSIAEIYASLDLTTDE